MENTAQIQELLDLIKSQQEQIKLQQQQLADMQKKIDEFMHGKSADYINIEKTEEKEAYVSKEDDKKAEYITDKLLTAEPAIMGYKTSDFTINKNGIIIDYNGDYKDVVIPYEVDGVEVKGFKTSLFAESAIESITIPKSMKKIPDGAFLGCENLKKCVIPDSVEKIGKYAFSGCESLEYIKLPKSIKAIGSYAFSECTSLSEVNLKDGIRNIKGKNIFVGCTGLTKVNLPGSLMSVPEGMFAFCTNLKNITIGEGIRHVRDNAFTGCGIENLKIPATLKNIHTTAFLGCNNQIKNYINDRFSGKVNDFTMRKNNRPRHAKARENFVSQYLKENDSRMRIDKIITEATEKSKEKKEEAGVKARENTQEFDKGSV